VDSGQVSEEESYAFYESRYRNAYDRLFTLVAGFYQKHAGKDRYFALANTLTRESDGVQARPDLAFGEITAGLTDLREAADQDGAGARPIREFIEAAAGQRTRARDLIGAAEQARLRAEDNTPNELGEIGRSRVHIDANDLYDAASGLYLAMTPRLGIQHAQETPEQRVATLRE
jgi:hypothetical protein